MTSRQISRGPGHHLAIGLACVFFAGTTPAQTYPDAWKSRMCDEMATVAIQALHDRDLGRPAKRFKDDGADSARIANLLVAKVYAEPSISSPKRAQAVAKTICHEQLANAGSR